MSITDILGQLGGLQSMARELGVPEQQVASGADALLPAILGGLQKQAQGFAVPDSFTHGSSEQRQRWFALGLRTGDPRACNTFEAQQL